MNKTREENADFVKKISELTGKAYTLTPLGHGFEFNGPDGLPIFAGGDGFIHMSLSPFYLGVLAMSGSSPKPIEKPLTKEQMRSIHEKDESVKAVVSLDWRETGNTESLNDLVSELITGDDCGLLDIGLNLVGADVKNGHVLVEVTASLSDFITDEFEGDKE